MNMKLIRRIVLAGTAAAVPLAVFGAVSAGAATPTKVKFTGSITCAVTGSLTASPPITLSSASHTLTLTATLKTCKGSTSKSGVTITGGHLKATATATASCLALSGGAPSGTVTWTANSPGAASTKQSFSTASISVSNSIITVKLPGSGGKATATGSFAGSKSSATAVVDQTESSLVGACTGAGVSKLTFTGKNGKSSITIG